MTMHRQKPGVAHIRHASSNVSHDWHDFGGSALANSGN
jgi:hypothetical protein